MDKKKVILARERIDLIYSPENVFCRAFVYFNEDLLMITGSEEDIMFFLSEYFDDKIYLLVLHKCPSFGENSKDNLNSIHIPESIKGIVRIDRRDKESLELPQHLTYSHD